MRYKNYKFGRDRSINKGALLRGEKSAFLAISRLWEAEFYWKFQSPHIRCNWRKFGCEQSVIKGTLLVAQRTFSAVSRFPLEGFSGTYTSHFPCMRYKGRKFGRHWWIIRETLLWEQSIFFTVSRLYLQAFSWNFVPRILHAYATKHVDCISASIGGIFIMSYLALFFSCAAHDACFAVFGLFFSYFQGTITETTTRYYVWSCILLAVVT